MYFEMNVVEKVFTLFDFLHEIQKEKPNLSTLLFTVRAFVIISILFR
jgi:hypothetical protein